MREFKHVSIFIKTRRAERGLSQGALSAAVGFKNGQYISNVERGVSSVPVAKIRSFAKALKVRPRDIINEMVKDYHDNIVRSSGEAF